MIRVTSEQIKKMKAKFAIATLTGLLAGGLALAQNTPATETATAPTISTETAATETAPAIEAAPVAAPQIAAVPVAAPEPAPAAAPAPEPAPAPAPAPAAPEASAVIPLIQFQDVPLTTAIENLARQANINYILDPKVSFGQPDEQGKVRPQPSISIRWENLSAEQALTALLNNYSLQLVEDPKTRIARVTIKDPAAPDPLVTQIIQLKFASPSNMLSSVQTVLTDKRSRVIADVRTSQLVVSATEKELLAVDSLVERLDTITKQVLIEAKLIETSKNPRTVKGINWKGTLEGQNISYGNNSQFAPVTSGESEYAPLATRWPKMVMSPSAGAFFPPTAFLNADGVNVVLSFLNEDKDAQILSTPRAVTLDNEEANLSVTRAYPIFKNTAGTQGSPGGSEVTYTNLGTILQVTPRISANDFINLKVVPTVSSIGGKASSIVAGTVSQADIYDIRTIQTEVMIPSGNTLVLGGLVSDESANGGTKVPLLGDIPGVGRLFRSSDKTQLKKNLIIFVTPTIVKDSDYQPTVSTFLSSKPSELEDDNFSSPWNSARPKDWSKKSTPTDN